MTQADEPRFFHLMQTLSVTFDVPASQEKIEAYWNALNDLPIEALEVAFGKVLRTSRFFPRPVELRDPVLAMQAEASAERRRLVDATGYLVHGIADAARTERQQAAAAARTAAETARRAALTPEQRAAEEEAVRVAERRRVQALHDLWTEQDRARVAHQRRRSSPVTRPDDETVQRCEACHSFRLVPSVTGEVWTCADCRTVAVA